MWPFDTPYCISYGCFIVTNSISSRFRDIQLQSACSVQIVIAHARYHLTCTPYVKFGYIFEFFTSTLPIHYDTFIGLRWRIKGVYSWDPNVKREMDQKFFIQKFVRGDGELPFSLWRHSIVEFVIRDLVVYSVSQKIAELFLAEFCQISTNGENC